MKIRICDISAKSEAKLRRVTRSYGKGDNLLVIEDVPTISCSSCGESYLTADTLHELDSIKQQRNDLATSRSVDVAGFA